MIITIDPKDPRSIYVQIVDEVRRALVLGLLDADQALPSVRQLAAELRVNPNTVVQAYRELENSGLVYTKRGQGTFASGKKMDDGNHSVLAETVAARALRDAYHNGLNVDELLEAIRKAADKHTNGAKP